MGFGSWCGMGMESGTSVDRSMPAHVSSVSLLYLLMNPAVKESKIN